MSKNLTEAEFWWMVGILEGEGFFDFNNGSQRVSIAMTDLDTIEKVSAIFTKITSRKYNTRHKNYAKAEHNTLYEVNVHGQGARDILMMIVPHMCARRRQRIWQVINGHRPKMQKLTADSLLQLVVSK